MGIRRARRNGKHVRARLPKTLSVESAIGASHCPYDVKPADFQQCYKSPWIQAVRSNPLLLNEPTVSVNDNPFSLVEETFRDYGWIPSEYVKMVLKRSWRSIAGLR